METHQGNSSEEVIHVLEHVMLNVDTGCASVLNIMIKIAITQRGLIRALTPIRNETIVGGLKLSIHYQHTFLMCVRDIMIKRHFFGHFNGQHW